jgi:hypothetical protein
MIDLSGASWRKSTVSNNGGNCLEITDHLPDVIALRDSKDPDGAILVIARAEWTAFVRGLKDGQFHRD